MEIFEDIQENSMIGKRVGVYELKREIGRGGMGAVYLAERADGEFRQTVAIKLIKRGMDTDLILKRFRRERQIIAALDHPNIVYFLAGGSTSDGLPYFVMEYIEGKPLYRFCDENKLSITERLEIFRQICDAVEAAHRIKVIHRDLKPSNILVKSDGTPKLLDFGIAKVLDPDLVVTEIDPTATAMRVMTPEYASPEQVRGEEVTPASDIYSLGIILYELLTGHRPYRLKRQVPHEVARVICEEIPSHPSVNLIEADNLVPVTDKEKTTLEYIFNARNTSLNELQSILSGNLDKIILKALRKDPAERYQTAAHLAADITRFLDNRPVKAESFSPEEITGGTSQKRSVAILPFKMIGADTSKNTDDIFLGIGLADALVSRLSGVQRLIVRPTSSVLPFSEANPLDAGKNIGVDFILDGTIRRVGERIRVTVQLLCVAEGSTVWAEKFDENFTDVLELEDSISDKAAKVLLPQLTGEEQRRLEKRGTNDPAAYQAYLRGRYFANQFTDESLLKAIEAYKEAVSLDLEYALPYVGIADFYSWSAIFGEIPSREGFQKAKAAAERALEIDPLLGEAYAIMAFIVFLEDWNWERAERLVRRALELNPNYYFAHECYSNFLTAQGHFDDGIEEMRRAEELDPLSPRGKLMTGWTLYQAGHFAEAVAKAEQATEMQPDFPQGLLHLGNHKIHTGQIKEAVEALGKSSRLWNSALPKYILCFALVADGRREEAEKVLQEILSPEKKGYVKPYFAAMGYAALGEIDKAFEWFGKAVEERNEWMIWFGTDPKLEFLRKDARYLKLLKETNNPIISHLTSPTTGETTTAETEKAIAVLPFKLLSAGKAETAEDEYLSIGLADALTMRLSNVRRFIVRPTSSVLPFGNQEIDPFAAGRELGVDFVVDGNIRRVGKRIRVAAQLLNVGENSTNWAERFDENYTDVLALEDSISERVTTCLLPTLTGEERQQIEKRGTNNPQAFDLYMRGRYFWNQFTPQGFPKAIEAFKKAVELDPEYALAYVGIADFYNWACIYGLFPPPEATPKVKEAALRALEIDDSLGEGYVALAHYYSVNLDYRKAEQYYRRAIELNPNYSNAHELLAAVLVGTGRFKEGMEEMRLAERLDPLSLRTKTLTVWTAYQARYFDEALTKAREIVALDANFFQGYMQVANILTEIGQAEEALETARKGIELMPESPLPIYQYCFALVGAGQIEKARQIVDEFESKAKKTYIPPYFLGMSHLSIGEIDKAFRCFEKALKEQTHWLIWFGTEPKLDLIRTDKRYFELFKQMNNPLIEKQATTVET